MCTTSQYTCSPITRNDLSVVRAVHRLQDEFAILSFYIENIILEFFKVPGNFIEVGFGYVGYMDV